jgi:glucosamine-6-phosphate deaminase
MRIEIVGPEDFAARAAEIVVAAVRRKPEIVLGLPTGRTPLGLYDELARRGAANEVDFGRATAFAIDELYGVPIDHPATNTSYLARSLGSVPMHALLVMDSAAPDAEAECKRFAALLEAAGGLDLAVLGIGRNGHIAFNEPGAAFDSPARRVRLEDSTREQYVPAFGSLAATPEFGLTLGMAELFAAREVLLLANGADKAAIVARTLEGPVSEDVPASALQRHASVTVLLDRAAAEGLATDMKRING